MAIFPAPPSDIQSIVDEPKAKDNLGPGGTQHIVLHLAGIADGIPAWGTNVVARDQALRKVWLNEPLLKSAIINVAVKYAKLPWSLSGEAERMNNIYTNVLNNVDRQRGWVHMWTKIVIDSLTQDNGGFGEIIRLEDKPNSPCVSLRQLDAARCRRTGDPDAPIRYFDRQNNPHDLKYYQVFDLTEASMPVENGYELQLSALSRALENAQIIRDVNQYMSEKVGGRWNRSIHLTTGVAQQALEDALEKQGNNADAAGMQHYMGSLILASHQADKPVSHVEIPLSSLPDGFDSDVLLRWYIILLSLALLQDPQEFAPLQGGHLGTSTQSVVLAQKGRTKGPDLFMSNVQQIMNVKGIIPRNVNFQYGMQDDAVDSERTTIQWRHAQIVNQLTTTGVISPQVGAAMLTDWGDLKPEYLTAMGIDRRKPETLGVQAPPPAPKAGTTQPNTDNQQVGNAQNGPSGK